MLKTIVMSAALVLPGPALADAVDDLLDAYRSAGAGPFDPARGERLWSEPHPVADGTTRRCSDCHGTDLAAGGRHVRTRKPIEPLAPSVNPERLSERATIEKWLRRNCDWTWNRECTPQEKGDLLAWLRRR